MYSAHPHLQNCESGAKNLKSPLTFIKCETRIQQRPLYNVLTYFAVSVVFLKCKLSNNYFHGAYCDAFR